MNLCETCIYSARPELDTQGWRWCAVWGYVNDATRKEVVNCSEYKGES